MLRPTPRRNDTRGNDIVREPKNPRFGWLIITGIIIGIITVSVGITILTTKYIRRRKRGVEEAILEQIIESGQFVPNFGPDEADFAPQSNDYEPPPPYFPSQR